MINLDIQIKHKDTGHVLIRYKNHVFVYHSDKPMFHMFFVELNSAIRYINTGSSENVWWQILIDKNDKTYKNAVELYNKYCV